MPRRVWRQRPTWGCEPPPFFLFSQPTLSKNCQISRPLTNPAPAACCPRRPLSGTYVTLAVSEKKHRLNRMSVRRTVHVRARRQHDAGRGAPAVPPCVNPPRVRAANTAATTLRAPGVSWGACTCMPDAKGPCTATVHVLYSVGVVRVLSWCSHALPPLPPPSSLSTCLLLPAP